jgi:hypothetical protein
VHYRLSDQDDPVVRAVVDSAAHWVHHAPSAERDRERLEQQTGVKSKRGAKLIRLSCCGRPVQDAGER